MSMFSYSGQAALAVLSDDPLVYFSLPTYFVFGAIYIAFAFSGELPRRAL
jgi:acetyl-CoA carboxylase beta subunit